MKVSCIQRSRRRAQAMSLIEVLIGAAVGSLILLCATSVFVYSLFSFAGLGNYAILTGQSKASIDAISRDMRESTGVLGASASGSVKSITLTNAFSQTVSKYTWEGGSGKLTCEKTGEPTRTFLTGCDQWDFTFYQRTPKADWGFYSGTDLSVCKLINMNWKCSRSILGKKINTETVVTAQVVLRNKP